MRNLRFKWLFLRKVIAWNYDKKVITQRTTENSQRTTEELISEFLLPIAYCLIFIPNF
jgi:hypothetical protein